MEKIRTYTRMTNQGYEIRNELTEEVYSICFSSKIAEEVRKLIKNILNS